MYVCIKISFIFDQSSYLIFVYFLGTIPDFDNNHLPFLPLLNTDLGSKQDAKTAINTSNIGQQSVNYAASAGSADYATSAGSATTSTSAGTANKANEATRLIASNGANKITANWGAEGGVMYLSFYVDGTQVAKIKRDFVG